MKELIQLVSTTGFSKLLGTSRQNVAKSGERALKEKYRGSFPPPEATDEDGRIFWFKQTAEEYAKQKKNGVD